MAPNYRLTEKVFREVKRYSINYLKDFILTLNDSSQSKKLVLKNGSELECLSADNPISLSGEALDFIIIDEAPGCKEEVWTHYLRERLADRQGWVLFIGTPKGRSWYYHLFLKGMDDLMPDFQSFHFTSWDNPYLERSELEALKRELPERAYRQEVMAEFLSDADSVFRNIRDSVKPCLSEPVKDRVYVAGVDLAKYVDYTVVTIADYENNNIVYFDRWHKTDWTITYDRISKAIKRYNNATTYVDSTGLGDPIFETLRNVPYGLAVKSFKFTQQSKQHLIDNLAWFFENNSIIIPDVPELINELEVFEYETLQSGKQRFNAPPGFHDDCVCSLGLCALGLRRGGDLIMAELDLRNF